MRLTSLALFFSAAALGSSQAIGAESTNDPNVENTYFNGHKVPPLLELTQDNFEKEVGLSKFVVIKYYRLVYPPTRIALPRFHLAKHPSQSLLPSLYRFCTDIPDHVRILLYLGSSSRR
jgi:hypothetical protein